MVAAARRNILKKIYPGSQTQAGGHPQGGRLAGLSGSVSDPFNCCGRNILATQVVTLSPKAPAHLEAFEVL